MNITEIERQLISTIADFAAIHNVNCHFSTGLARRIHQTGKEIDDLTIGEFSAISQRYSDDFNGISVWEKDEEVVMNAPTLSHRSSGKELPENFGDLLNTVGLATERVKAIALLVEEQLGDQTVSSNQISVCVDTIRHEVDDIDAWLLWWLEESKKGGVK